MKTTFNFGELVPIFFDEALPGDTMRMNPTIFARLSTQLKPVMDNMYLDIHFWAVANRNLWDNWQRFCGEQINPGDSTDYEVPIITASSSFTAGGFFDHLGVPPGVTHAEVTNLFGRAYHEIWNQWYRDENLQDSVESAKDDGPDAVADYDVLLPRGKRHDYFTSCLPSPQKGPSVEIELTGTAPVTVDTTVQGGEMWMSDTSGNDAYVRTAFGGLDGTLHLAPGYNSDPIVWSDQNELTMTGLADLSSVAAATINSMRQSIAIQRLYEKDNRGGTRYKEVLMSHFGVTVDDGRLQRPEFLGGTTIPFGVNQVVQQSGYGAEDTPAEYMGDMAGWATATKQGRGFTKTFREHSVILCLASARADLNYQQGLDRTFSRRTRWEFYWPELANLGEQAVLSKEIYADGTVLDEQVFGYQQRFAEYRYKPSVITGKFRSDASGSLDIWHLAQDFSARPALGSTFIEENPPVERIVAVPTEPEILLDAFFDYKSIRPMPLYGVPGLTRL